MYSKRIYTYANKLDPDKPLGGAGLKYKTCSSVCHSAYHFKSKPSIINFNVFNRKQHIKSIFREKKTAFKGLKADIIHEFTILGTGWVYP